MITTLLLMFLTLLDIQRPPKPDDPIMEFSVTELSEESMTGCATLPHGGRVSDQSLTVDWVMPNDSIETSTTQPFALEIGQAALSESQITSRVMPYDPPGLPDPPEPETPPVAVVPEPPTAAILTISGLALIYLLFGKKRQKSHAQNIRKKWFPTKICG